MATHLDGLHSHPNGLRLLDRRSTSRAQGLGTSVEGIGLAKRMAVGSFPPQRSQCRTSDNPPIPPQKIQIPELCRKCNRVH